MKKKITHLLCASLLTLAPALSYAQAPVLDWQKAVGGDNIDEMRSVLLTSDGGYLLAGTSWSGATGDKDAALKGEIDYWVVKLNSNRAIQWQKTIGGSKSDYLYKAVPSSDGGYFLGGYSNSDISGDKSDTARGVAARGGVKSADMWVVKIDANGNKLWDKTLGGEREDYGQTIVATFDGGCIIGGYSGSGMFAERTIASKGGRDNWIVKLSANGTKEWDKTFGTSVDDYWGSMIQTKDTGYLVGCYTNGGKTGDKTDTSRGGEDFWVLKLNKAGDIQWQKTIGGDKNDEVQGLLQTADGYVIAGTSESFIAGEKTEDAFSFNTPDWWVVKINDTGKVMWDKTLGGEDYDVPTKIMQSNDGNYVIAGYSRSVITATSLGNKTDSCRGGDDYWWVKLSKTGAIKWQKVVGGDQADQCYDVQQTADGGYVLGGWSASGATKDKTETLRGVRDYWIMKLTKDCDTTETSAKASFCQNYLYTLPGGRTVNVGGIFRDTLTGMNGCDSIVITSLTMVALDTSVTVSGSTLTSGSAFGTYQWIDCATKQPVSGATGRTFTPSASGNYALIITTLNNCTDTSDCYTAIGTGISGISNDHTIAVYPNPANTQVMIQSDIAMQQVTLMNVVGAVVYRSADNAGKLHVVNTANLASGIYTLTAQTEKGTIIQKLEIRH